jgi:hypothetical protein
MALVLLFFVFYLFFREKFFLQKFGALFVLFVLSGSIHSYGGVLFIGVFIAEILSFFLDNYVIWEKPKPLIKLFGIGFLRPDYLQLDFFHAKTIFFNLLPFPTIFFALKNFDCFKGIICFFSVIAAFMDIRALTVFELLACIMAAKTIQSASFKTKIGFVLFLVAQTIFYFVCYGSETWKIIVFN